MGGVGRVGRGGKGLHGRGAWRIHKQAGPAGDQGVLALPSNPITSTTCHTWAGPQPSLACLAGKCHTTGKA